MVAFVHIPRAKRVRVLLLVVIIKTTTIGVSFSSFCRHDFSNALNNLLYQYRYEDQWLRASKVRTVKVTSETHCLDLCMRESFCASLNLKRKWKVKAGALKHFWLCQINKESLRESDAKTVEKVNSTHFDVNTLQIREVNYSIL